MIKLKRFRPIILAAVATLTGGLLLGCASTPPIKDAKGKAIPGSIASLERVELNGRSEWITIRGRDATKPLLLFLAGGPGGSELSTVRRTLGGLEEHFVVIVWDQPGAGKSYRAVRHSEITPEIYIEDAGALVELLCERFDREKVYLVGESWGSAFGVLLAERYPERVEALFGTGQMVAFLENDLQCYRLAVQWARERGDKKKLDRLEKQGPPPYYGRGTARKEAAFLMDTFAYMRDVKGVRTGGDTIRDIFSPEYTLVDKINWIRGLLKTLDEVYPKLWDLDLRRAAPRLEVPVYLFIGRHDVNASIPLLESYYALLEAPAKEIVWFERSGHTPWSSEPDRFVAEVVKRATLE